MRGVNLNIYLDMLQIKIHERKATPTKPPMKRRR